MLCNFSINSSQVGMETVVSEGVLFVLALPVYIVCPKLKLRFVESLTGKLASNVGTSRWGCERLDLLRVWRWAFLGSGLRCRGEVVFIVMGSPGDCGFIQARGQFTFIYAIVMIQALS
jgi:hypothetical protein